MSTLTLGVGTPFGGWHLNWIWLPSSTLCEYGGTSNSFRITERKPDKKGSNTAEILSTSKTCMAEELTKEVLHFLVLWDLWKVLKEGNMYHLNPEQKIHNFDINRGFTYG